jgi:hypothetical protein
MEGSMAAIHGIVYNERVRRFPEMHCEITKYKIRCKDKHTCPP